VFLCSLLPEQHGSKFPRLRARSPPLDFIKDASHALRAFFYVSVGVPCSQQFCDLLRGRMYGVVTPKKAYFYKASKRSIFLKFAKSIKFFSDLPAI